MSHVALGFRIHPNPERKCSRENSPIGQIRIDRRMLHEGLVEKSQYGTAGLDKSRLTCFDSSTKPKTTRLGLNTHLHTDCMLSETMRSGTPTAGCSMQILLREQKTKELRLSFGQKAFECGCSLGFIGVL